MRMLFKEKYENPSPYAVAIILAQQQIVFLL